MTKAPKDGSGETGIPTPPETIDTINAILAKSWETQASSCPAFWRQGRKSNDDDHLSEGDGFKITGYLKYYFNWSVSHQMYFLGFVLPSLTFTSPSQSYLRFTRAKYSIHAVDIGRTFNAFD